MPARYRGISGILNGQGLAAEVPAAVEAMPPAVQEVPVAVAVLPELRLQSSVAVALEAFEDVVSTIIR